MGISLTPLIQSILDEIDHLLRLPTWQTIMQLDNRDTNKCVDYVALLGHNSSLSLTMLEFSYPQLNSLLFANHMTSCRPLA